MARISLVLVLALTVPQAVWAEDEELNYCSIGPDQYEQLADDLVGFWQVRNLQGYMERNGKRVALPPLVETQETMSIIGGEMSMAFNDGKGPYTINIVDPATPGWEINPDPDEAVDGVVLPSSGDVAMATGCSSDQDFVRLYAEGTSMSEAGPVDFEVRLFVANDSTMYGVVSGRVSGYNAMARRIMTAAKM